MAEQDRDQPTTTPETPASDEKPEQNVTVEDVGPALKRLSIQLPESRIGEKIEEAFKELENDAQLPGFRRGRAPRRLLERRFGSAIRDDVKGQLLSEAYSQAIEEHDIQVIGEPDVKDVENIELPESGPLSFEVEVEVAPSVELPSFEELKVTQKSAEVGDDDVTQELERLRETFGQMQAVDDAAVQPDDFVTADVHIYPGEDAGDDAEPITHHPQSNIMVAGESRDYRGHVAGIVVDDLGKRLADKKPGDVERVSMTGPSGHEDERIRDQPITIAIRIEQIQRLEPAPVESILEQMGMESEDDLKQRIRQMLEQRRQQEQQQELQRQVTDQLAERVELELPEGLTSRQAERVLSRRRMDLYYQGKSEQEVEQEIAEMRGGSEEEARKQLKDYFILDQAARDLEIEVGEQELNGQIAMTAMQQGRRPEKLRQEMQQRGEIEQMYFQIRERKTLDRILEKVQIVDEDGTPVKSETSTGADDAERAESDDEPDRT